MSDRQVVLFAVAAWSGATVGRGPAPWMAVLALGAFLVVRRPVLAMVAVALLAGGLAAQAQDGLQSPEPGAWRGWLTLAGDPVVVGDSLRVDARIERSSDRGAGRRVQVTAPAAGIAGTALARRLSGERVAVAGELKELSPQLSFLHDRHLVATVTVDSLEAVSGGSRLTRVSNGLRRLLVDGAEALPLRQRPLYNGLLLGDDRGQSAVTADDFEAAGLSHLLVVSGGNVAFVLALAGPLLRRLGIRARLGATLGVLAWFAVLTRLEPSVLRASAMAAVAAVAVASGREASGLRLLALAVAALVALDPFLVHRLGFQLSVAASAGILVLSAPLVARLPGPRWLVEAAAVTLGAQMAVAPLLITSFGGVPVVSLVANVAAGPVVGPITVWGLVVGVPAGLLGGRLAMVLHFPTRLLVGWLAGVARVSAAVPAGEIGLRSGLVLAVAVPALWIGVRRRRRRLVGVATLAVALAVASPALVLSRPPPWAAAPAPGVEVWRAGGATVVALDFRASPPRTLAGLRRGGVRRVDALVVRSTRSGLAATVDSLVERYRPALVRSPSASGRPGALPPETTITGRVGGVHLELTDHGDRLSVRATPAVRGPPPGPATPEGDGKVGERRRRAAAPEAALAWNRGPGGSVGSAGMELALGETRFDITTRAVVMGILNRTPDSFYDQGTYYDFDAFLTKADQLVADGADFLDVGGVKAGPGPAVGEQEELDRVVPAVEALRTRFGVPLSVDTWRASVAEACFAAGACVGNDISGFADPDYLAVCAAHGASVVATHIRLQPRVPDPEPTYPGGDVVTAVADFLMARAAAAEHAGIPRERIMVDAGLDLGKSEAQSLELLRAHRRLGNLGYPLFLSASNKRFLGHLLGTDVDDRRDGTAAAHALGIALGCRVLRAHDVRGARRVAATIAAILEAA